MRNSYDLFAYINVLNSYIFYNKCLARKSDDNKSFILGLYDTSLTSIDLIKFLSS